MDDVERHSLLKGLSIVLQGLRLWIQTKTNVPICLMHLDGFMFSSFTLGLFYQTHMIRMCMVGEKNVQI